MRKSASIPSINCQELLSPNRIVGELDIQNNRYLIVTSASSFEFNDDASTAQSSLSLVNSSHFLEMTRFEVNGCHCAIFKVESSLTTAALDIANLLSKQELQIATLVSLGKTNKQIASQLHISEWTVATYLRRIFAKLGVDSRAAMVYYCASLIQQLEQCKTFGVDTGYM